MIASSSASWSRFSPPSNFVNGHVSTMWFVVSRWPQSRCINYTERFVFSAGPRSIGITNVSQSHNDLARGNDVLTFDILVDFCRVTRRLAAFGNVRKQELAPLPLTSYPANRMASESSRERRSQISSVRRRRVVLECHGGPQIWHGGHSIT